MQLLSAPQGKSRLDVENAQQQVRAQELDLLIKQKRKELDNLDKLSIKALSEQGIEHYEEEKLWKERISSLTTEVEALESRKKSALLPLEEREKVIQTKESALLQREEQITVRESNAEYEKEALEDKLDRLSEREQGAEKYAQVLNNREFSIQLREKQVEDRLSALTVILRETYEDITKAQQEAAQYKAVLKGRDVSISEREKNVDMQEKSFSDREKRIADRYKTLLRAITETNLKKNA